jgi:hypothetical protein
MRMAATPALVSSSRGLVCSRMHSYGCMCVCAALCHDTDASFTYLPCPAVDQIADCFFGVRVDPVPLRAAATPVPDTSVSTTSAAAAAAAAAAADDSSAVGAVVTTTTTATATATATSGGDVAAATVAASVHPLLKKPRQFSIDASPHLLYARGAFVDLLVRCSVSKYVEFRTLDATYLWLQDQFHRVRVTVGWAGSVDVCWYALGVPPQVCTWVFTVLVLLCGLIRWSFFAQHHTCRSNEW